MKILTLAEAIEKDATATLYIVDGSGIDLETFEIPGARFVKLILFKDDEPVGFLAGEMVDNELLQLFKIYCPNEDKGDVTETFLKYLYRSESPVISGILTNDRDSHRLTNEILPGTGYALGFKKRLFSKDISSLEYGDSGELQAVKVSEFSHDTILTVFHDSIRDHPIYATMCDRIEDEFESLKEDLSSETIAEYWKLYTYHDQIVGYAFPTLFRHNPDQGTIRFIGVVPKFTGRGWGKLIHLHALSILSDMGARTYLGSTETSNLAMVRIFQQNGCTIRTTQLFFTKQVSGGDINHASEFED